MSTNNLPHWDLTPIYKSVTTPDYLEDLSKVESLSKLIIKDVKEHASLTKIVNEFNELYCIYATLMSYVNAQLTTDTSNSTYIKAMSKLQALGLIVDEADNLFKSEISYYKAEFDNPELKEYKYILEHLEIQSKHQMSLCEEALASDLARSGVDAFERLYDSISSTISNAEKTVIQLRCDAMNPDREVRKASYLEEKRIWNEHKVALAACLNSIKGTVLTLEKKRGWDDPLDRSAFQSRVSRKALDALIKTLENNLEMFRSFFNIKAKLLKLDKLAWYDLFAPVGDNHKEYTFTQARDFITRCFSLFDSRMGEFALNAFNNNWIDAEPRKGKVGGAYDTSFIKVKQSRILANYDGSFDSLSTLAHELGHAYHDSIVMSSPALLADYPMTVAETASIFAEQIVFSEAIKAASKEESISLIENYLSSCAQVCVDILSRFYFERGTFEKRREGELTADELTELMRKAQEATYGDAVEDKHELMWAAKGHYYSSSFSFYNYPYAFGQLFALGLYAKSQREENFKDTYRELLLLTGKQSANAVAKAAGCDIEDEAFWQSGMDVISSWIKRLEELAFKC